MNGLAVNGFKGYSPGAAGENQNNIGQSVQFTVRDGNAVSNTGAAEFFTFKQCFEQFSGIDPCLNRCQMFNNFFQ